MGIVSHLTGIIRILAGQKPVEDMVVTLYARHLVGHTGLLQQV